MRNGTVLLLFTLSLAASARADGVRFDQIPADATGYMFVDVDRFLASDLVREMDPSKSLAANSTKQFGGHIASSTVYSLPEGDTSTPVVLLRGEDKVLHRAQAFTDGKDVVVVSYDNHDVHCSPINPTLGAAFGLLRSRQKAAVTELNPANGRTMLSLGFGGGAGDDMKWVADDTYTTIVAPGLLVGTTSLRSMARALDVLTDKKPSLAQSDPHDLKGTVPPGAFVCGTGLTAFVRTGSTTQPTDLRNPESDNFGLSMFGALRGKATLARFDMGEDEHNVYVHASVAMVDAESATQLKNFLVGIKALISLSQEKAAPLIDPVDVSATDKDVLLRWTWPTAKLDELARVVKDQGKHGDPLSKSESATAPSAQSIP